MKRCGCYIAKKIKANACLAHHDENLVHVNEGGRHAVALAAEERVYVRERGTEGQGGGGIRLRHQRELLRKLVILCVGCTADNCNAIRADNAKRLGRLEETAAAGETGASGRFSFHGDGT